MLKRITPSPIDDNENKENGMELITHKKITSIEKKHFFHKGLEYASPARGHWNIVHIGMLVPGCHQIYIGGLGCIYGVVLTAAEMNAMDRYSSVIVTENDILDARRMEPLIYNGIIEILERLPSLPPAVLVFPTCMHRFMGTDMNVIYKRLRKKYPSIDFVDCYMDPIMDDRGLNSEQYCRRQVYAFLHPSTTVDKKQIGIIGNDLSIPADSDIRYIINQFGFDMKDITQYKDYTDYQTFARSSLMLYTNPNVYGAKALFEHKHNIPVKYLPETFDMDQIEIELRQIYNYLAVLSDTHNTEDIEDWLSSSHKSSEDSLKHAYSIVGDVPIAIDYQAVFRPFELAKLLTMYGFKVSRIYADFTSDEDIDAFNWIKNNVPDLDVYSAEKADMRYAPRSTATHMIAIGQLAAYLTGTKHYVNLIANDTRWGFSGIRRLSQELEAAFIKEGNPEQEIIQKGLGGVSCIGGGCI